MPTWGINGWIPRDDFERIEAGRYLGHTYNLPVYKIPAASSIPAHPQGSAIDRHELFDLIEDDCQQTPVEDTELEDRFCSRLAEHLRRAGAPAEQFERIGINLQGRNEHKF